MYPSFGPPNPEIGRKMADGRLLFRALLCTVYTAVQCRLFKQLSANNQQYFRVKKGDRANP